MFLDILFLQALPGIQSFIDRLVEAWRLCCCWRLDVDVAVSRQSKHLLRVTSETSGRSSYATGKTRRSTNKFAERQRSQRWTLNTTSQTILKFISIFLTELLLIANSMDDGRNAGKGEPYMLGLWGNTSNQTHLKKSFEDYVFTFLICRSPW